MTFCLWKLTKVESLSLKIAILAHMFSVCFHVFFFGVLILDTFVAFQLKIYIYLTYILKEFFVDSKTVLWNEKLTLLFKLIIRRTSVLFH